MFKEYDLIIIGGGISAMTAALMAAKNKINNIVIIEREKALGGILNECIDNCYGFNLYKTELTGPECVNIIKKELKEYNNISIKYNTEVIRVDKNNIVKYINPEEGVTYISGKAIIVATGCREKFSGNIKFPLSKFAGIFTIGSVLRIVNTEGYIPGREPIIIADNNWALKVAKRITIEGANIKGIILNNGFKLDEDLINILKEFNAPIIENSKVIDLLGDNKIEGVRILNEVTNKITSIGCDSLMMSVGYFPEIGMLRDLDINIDADTLAPVVNNYSTSVKGIFACGSVIYGLKSVDENNLDGLEAGKVAAEYINGL